MPRISLKETLRVAALVAATYIWPAAAEGLPEGASKLEESYQDWQLRCVRRDEAVRCAISQILAEAETGKRAVAIELQAGADGSARGHVLLPFGLKLADGARLSIGEATAEAALPFSTCLPSGCAVPLAFDAGAVDRLKAADTLTVAATALADGEPVSFGISLKGFSAAIGRSAEIAAR